MKPYNCPCGGVPTIKWHQADEDGEGNEEHMTATCHRCCGIRVEAEYTDALIKKWNDRVKQISLEIGE